jgi:hypothetical protein
MEEPDTVSSAAEGRGAALDFLFSDRARTAGTRASGTGISTLGRPVDLRPEEAWVVIAEDIVDLAGKLGA